MNEERNNGMEQLDPRRKTALLRYLSVLFAAAFLLVLLSLFMQIRNSNITISQLSQSSTSAIQNAERLQQDNAALRAEKEQLEQQLEDVRKEIEELTRLSQTENQRIMEAYEQLLRTMQLVVPGSADGNVAAGRALEALKVYENYLGQKGLEIYHQLMEEGNE